MNDLSHVTIAELLTLALSMLTEKHGISVDTWNILHTLLYQDIPNLIPHVTEIDDRFYLKCKCETCSNMEWQQFISEVIT